MLFIIFTKRKARKLTQKSIEPIWNSSKGHKRRQKYMQNIYHVSKWGSHNFIDLINFQNYKKLSSDIKAHLKTSYFLIHTKFQCVRLISIKQ